MARWVKLAARSFVAAAVVGAAQLGVAQALAVLVWSAVPTPDVWRRHLTWLVLIFAAAVLGGVAGGRRSVREIRRAIANRRADAAAARHSGLVAHRRGLRAAQKRAVAAARSKTVDTARGVAAMATRICATVFSALGAAASFALVWLPARSAFAPADMRVLAITAGVGIAVGAILSVLSLAAAPIAANVGVWLIGLWLFGLTSVGMAIATDQPTITPRLGVLDAPGMIGPDEWWLGPNLIVAVAAVFGVAVAGTARWLAAHRLAIALSGVAGPVVLAAAYLVVGPAGDLMSSYVAALLAATVGLLTSAATAAVHRGAGDTAKTARTPAALTASPSATARRPLAIESGRGAQDPASQYPAADPLYVAPPRAASVPPARPEPSVAARRSMPAATPVPPIPAWPMAPAKAAPAPPPRSSTGRASRTSAAPVQPPARPPAPMAPPPEAPVVSPQVQPAGAPPSPSVTPRQRPAQPPTSKTSERKPTGPKPTGRKPTGRKPTETKPAAAEPANQPPAAKEPVTSGPGESSATKRPAAQKRAAEKPARRGTRRGRADRATTPARMEHKATTSDEVLPRTVRSAEVVAVEALPKGRRARRRAAKLAAERAAAEERLTRQIEREATTMNKREREHVDWVKHLVSLPNDPNLTNRQK